MPMPNVPDKPVLQHSGYALIVPTAQTACGVACEHFGFMNLGMITIPLSCLALRSPNRNLKMLSGCSTSQGTTGDQTTVIQVTAQFWTDEFSG
mmetsp:Transcript_23654/g.42625  ORF Transcript_23654/g.42625 Transcript_23654/m.42625 type:complete len:93 (-) Transcript_23654:576-854(-)